MNKLIESLIGKAKELLEKDGHLAPVALAMKGENVIAPIMLEFETDNEKYATYRAVGDEAKRLSVDRVVMINDAAMRRYDNPEESEKALKNYATESPLTYPEDMREDGIFVQDLNLVTEEITVYFLRYKRRKEGGFRFYDIMTLVGEKGKVMGEVMNSVLRGFKGGN